MSEVNPYQSPTEETAATEEPSRAVRFRSAGQITLGEMRAAFRLAKERQAPLRFASLIFMAIFTGLLLYVGISSLASHARAGLVIITVASCVPCYLLGRYLLAHWRLYSYSRRGYGAFGYIEVEYSSAGIHTKSATTDSLLAWSDFASVRSNDTVAIVTYRHSRQFLVAPQSTLQSPARWDDFVQYLRDQVACNAGK